MRMGSFLVMANYHQSPQGQHSRVVGFGLMTHS